ncbi:YodL domain-containing protein [Cohnella sp. AR92]|uniref:YodL domain-containing protein n=1 Tax=Cohnella sp. AR92 TaxID=648716 RepID=UPI000F8C87B9|nr:YodL domain-containing protein [Cohnella sp. AR92]RUS44911.1 hypothetical protein ELR57_21885 [Cohnella sp. AR92]
MSTLIVSQTDVFMKSSQVEGFMQLMMDAVHAASDVKIKKSGRKVRVSFSFATFEAKTIDSFICNLADNGYTFSEKRGRLDELSEAFNRENEFGIWQVSSFHLRDYGLLPLQEFRDKRGTLDLSLHERVYGATLAQLKINPSLPTIQILQQIYRAFNVDKPLNYGGRSISIGDVIQLRGEYYYVDQSTFEWIAVM